MKRCPFCFEEIQDAAIKCKHCGSMLARGDSAAPPDIDDADMLVDTRRVPGRIAPPPADDDADDLDLGDTRSRFDLAPGRMLLGKYRIERRLGKGGMGVVFEARDTELDGLRVAIKVLPAILAENVRSVAALKREAAISLRLTHPSICRLHTFNADGELKFLVMEFIDGQTLDDLLQSKPDGRLSLDELLPIARQVAAALDHAHAQQPPILHRDIKPSNIMIARDGTVKVVDFGIAREMKDSRTRVTGQETSGTLLYCSPEQYNGRSLTPASDVYSFAATLYECLAGHPPFWQGSIGHQLLNNAPEAIEGVEEGVNEAVLRGLAKKASGRLRGAGELVDLLGGVVSPRPKERKAVRRPQGFALVPEPRDTSVQRKLPLAVDRPTPAKPSPGDIITNSIGMKLVYIPSGEFMMGSPEDEEGRWKDETQHLVKLGKGFHMGVTQVTQAQWQGLIGNDPSHFKGNDLPVENVSLNDAMEFCRKLSEKESKRYRLPTEAEWEYACRAGSTGPYAGRSLDDLGWYSDNSGGKTHPVATKEANAWGIFDMHGNVFEWCQDWYADYPKGKGADPTGPANGSCRLLRGGAWGYYPTNCRSANRGRDSPRNRNDGVGFRVALDSG